MGEPKHRRHDGVWAISIATAKAITHVLVIYWTLEIVKLAGFYVAENSLASVVAFVALIIAYEAKARTPVQSERGE